nr:hypothetical transcript [Hymenolepis microstoma]
MVSDSLYEQFSTSQANRPAMQHNGMLINGTSRNTITVNNYTIVNTPHCETLVPKPARRKEKRCQRSFKQLTILCH